MEHSDTLRHHHQDMGIIKEKDMIQEMRNVGNARSEVVTRIIQRFLLDERTSGDGLDIEPNGSVSKEAEPWFLGDQEEGEEETKPVRPSRQRSLSRAERLTGAPRLSIDPDFLDPVA